jgi:hypothetical protein
MRLALDLMEGAVRVEEEGARWWEGKESSV